MKQVAIISPFENLSQYDLMSNLYSMPRYGTMAIATSLKKAGYEVRVFCEFIGNEIDWEYVLSADYVCFSLMSFCAEKGYRYANMIRDNVPKPIIMGGSHPSVLPEECLEHCDYVVHGEGEQTLIELLDAIEQHKNLNSIGGISYRDDKGNIIHNLQREFMEDIDSPTDLALYYKKKGRPLTIRKKPLWTRFFPLDSDKRRWYPSKLSRNVHRLRRFARALMPGIRTKSNPEDNKIKLLPIQTSRGCPQNCSFCAAPRELGTKYRTKSIETVVADLRSGKDILKSDAFIFVDNDFTVKTERTKRLLKTLTREFGDSLDLIAFARVDVSKKPDLLELMRPAGVKALFVGFESINDETLRLYKKGQTLEKIEKSVDIIHSHDIKIVGSMVFGSDHDTDQIVKDSIKWCIEKDIHHICLFSLYDFPSKTKVLGCPQAIQDDRFIHKDWRYYTGNFVIHYPKRMKPSTLQKGIIDGYRNFYDWKIRDKKAIGNNEWVARKKYCIDPLVKTMNRYANTLEEKETGLYDENEVLLANSSASVGGS